MQIIQVNKIKGKNIKKHNPSSIIIHMYNRNILYAYVCLKQLLLVEQGIDNIEHKNEADLMGL